METFLKFVEVLAVPASGLIMGLVGWLLAHATSWVNAKAKNAWLAGALARLDDAVMTVVKSLQQTVANDLKTSGGGELTAVQANMLKADAIALVKSYLGPKGLALLEQILGVDQLMAILQAKIEASVHDVKQAQAALQVADVSTGKAPLPAAPAA